MATILCPQVCIFILHLLRIDGKEKKKTYVARSHDVVCCVSMVTILPNRGFNIQDC